MGFFKDFKRDFAQAVNELVPDKDGLQGVYDDEDMVNTFDEVDDIEIAPEDLLEDLDDLDDFFEDSNNNPDDINDDVQINMNSDDEKIGTDFGELDLALEEDNIPEAEIIPENIVGGIPIDDVDEVVQEYVGDISKAEDSEKDELTAVDTLDETDMLEYTEDAMLMEMGSDSEVVAENNLDTFSEPEALEDTSELNDTVDCENGKDDADDADAETVNENLEDAADLLFEDTTVFASEEDDDSADETSNEENVSKWDGLDIGQAALDAIKKEEDYQDDDLDGNIIESNGAVEPVNDMSDMETMNTEVNDIMSDEITYITKGTTVKGNIETEGGVDIIGKVVGNVTCGNKLILGGIIVGDVKAKELYANAAKIEGQVSIEGNAKIGVGSVIVGNVSALSAVVAGAVNGDIDVHGPVIVDSTAVIMGNIKSRSVQINNGAVIEGFCSQCYSEIDVKSFFE